ncbi:MAG: site-specific DNA-methyltransferase [Nanoarchaeota archaeon]|nr:site-specific DNA-methyltransferase [Nanoarchaeota archaeon]
MILQGDCLKKLKDIQEESIDMCMTSPPYWALRDYGVKGQLGLESNFDKYVMKLCDIFDEVKRILKKQGTCWVNLGDTYYTKSGNDFLNDKINSNSRVKKIGINKANQIRGKGLLKSKNLALIPFRFALEMQKRGWIIRNVIIWHKPNCMPSSVKDRFTVDFEYLFFFSKNKKYYFKTQREPHKISSIKRTFSSWNGHREPKSSYCGMNIKNMCHPQGRNKRTVWKITTKPFRDAHFAVYPEEFCEIPIKAGCPENGIVLDPFFGAGTTGLVALKQNKKFIGIELNSKYIKIAQKRLQGVENGIPNPTAIRV